VRMVHDEYMTSVAHNVVVEGSGKLAGEGLLGRTPPLGLVTAALTAWTYGLRVLHPLILRGSGSPTLLYPACSVFFDIR